MKLLLYSFVLGLLATAISFGQLTVTQTAATAGSLETGYAVVTPLAGTGEGLSVSETFGEQIGVNLFQASVLNSPLVTLTDVVLNVDPQTGSNTGIAIINPSTSLATVVLSARNQQGAEIATRTITIGAHQQISDFVTDLFPGEPNFAQGVSGLLFISSNIPIGVVALAFSGGTFTSLPVAAQLSGTNALNATTSTTPATVSAPATATITTPVTTASNGITITGVAPTTTFTPITPTFNGVTTPPTLLPSPAFTNPTGTLPITGSAASLVTATGVAPVQAIAVPATPPQNVSSAVMFAVPQLSAGVGGPGALLLPQVATGGGWVSQITIANPSASAQTVRVDFFNAAGAPLATRLGSTVPSVVIAPGGVATLTL
jgi:hypothetical protein